MVSVYAMVCISIVLLLELGLRIIFKSIIPLYAVSSQSAHAFLCSRDQWRLG